MSRSDEQENINFRAVNIRTQLPLSIITFANETPLVCRMSTAIFFYEESRGHSACLKGLPIIESDHFASRATLSLRTYIEKSEYLPASNGRFYRCGRFHEGPIDSTVYYLTRYFSADLNSW